MFLVFLSTMRGELLNKNVNQGLDDKICQCLLKTDLIMLEFDEKEEKATKNFSSFLYFSLVDPTIFYLGLAQKNLLLIV